MAQVKEQCTGVNAVCGGIDSAPDGKTWKTIVWGTGSWFKKTMLLSGTGRVNLYKIIKKS